MYIMFPYEAVLVYVESYSFPASPPFFPFDTFREAAVLTCANGAPSSFKPTTITGKAVSVPTKLARAVWAPPRRAWNTHAAKQDPPKWKVLEAWALGLVARSLGQCGGLACDVPCDAEALFLI